VLRVRLRQVDVKAEHFERQVQRVEQERDMWEKKYEVRPEHGQSHMVMRFSLRILQDAQAKYRESKAELDELVQNMEGL
jgi:tropomyosin, fungi type